MTPPTYEEAVKQRTAILQNPRHPFYSEARHYCDLHRLESEEQFLQAIAYLSYKAFMERSEPYRDMKSRWLGLYPSTRYLQTDTGAFEAFPPVLPDHVTLAFAEIDRIIARIALECGLVIEHEATLKASTPAEFAEQWTAMEQAVLRARGAPRMVFNQIGTKYKR